MEEIWKDVVGFEDKYQVSDFGRVRSLDRVVIEKGGRIRFAKGKILKPNIDVLGYLHIDISNDGKRYPKTIHRLVATAFIPNPENKPTINHKNGIHDDNHLSNLEWNTYSENGFHSYRELGRIGPGTGKFGSLNNNAKPVNQFTRDGEFIRLWDCANDIERELSIPNTEISACCTNKQKTSRGFIWQFADPVEVSQQPRD